MRLDKPILRPILPAFPDHDLYPERRDMIEFLKDDITRLSQRFDAIVNAANQHLQGRGGVDGAIHRAAGPGLQDELALHYPHGIATGSAVATTGHRLNARYIIHAVGPMTMGHVTQHEEQQLRQAYRNVFQVAIRLGVKTIALPAIGTGVYGFPMDRAAEIAISVARKAADRFDRITLVAFDEDTRRAYQSLLGTLIRRNVPAPPNGTPMLQVITRGTVVGYYAEEARATAAGRLVEQLRQGSTAEITVEDLDQIVTALEAQDLTPDDPAAQPAPADPGLDQGIIAPAGPVRATLFGAVPGLDDGDRIGDGAEEEVVDAEFVEEDQ